jgi:hypothetical protein
MNKAGDKVDVAGFEYELWSRAPKTGHWWATRIAGGETLARQIRQSKGRWVIATGVFGPAPQRDVTAPVDPITHARSTDPVTSKVAARRSAMRAGTHKARLLESYFDAQPAPAVGMESCPGLTDLEAAAAADLLSVGYWKRCSDLRNDGLIEPMLHASGANVIRYTENGDANMVCRITDMGMATLMAMKEPNAKEPEHVHSVCITCGGFDAVHHSDCERLAELNGPGSEAADIIIDGNDQYGQIG